MPQYLAQLVRARHPGAYDDLDDFALEAAVRRKYPGVYDDIPMTPRKPASTEDFIGEFQPPQQDGSSVGRFLGNAWDMVNPVTIAKGVGQAVLHPIDTAGALLKAQGQQFGQAADAYGQGRYSEMLGHGAAGVLPILGPMAAHIGERIGQGDIAGGLGAATGLVGSVVVPGAAARAVKGLNVPALLKNRNPVAAEAVEAGAAAGVPIDAATATGNRFVRAAQHAADRSLGGSMVAEKAARAQQQGLATMGEQLAAKGYASPVTSEQAGLGVREAVLEQIRRHADDANEAYDALRAIEADPAHTRVIQPELTGSAAAEGSLVPAARSAQGAQRFAKAGASVEQLWQGVLGDARRNGFEGSADSLRAEFMQNLAGAKALGRDLAQTGAEYGQSGLLAEVRKYGGIDPGWQGQFEEINHLKQRIASTHGPGVANNIVRAKGNGLGLDDLLQQLQQGGRWPELADVDDLYRALEGASGKAQPKAPTIGKADLEHLLRASGVEPGAKWWSGGAEHAGAQTIALPVDLRGAKAALRPVYESLRREAELVPLMGDKARALTALDRLVGGPDHAPLSVVDGALGELKSFTRTEVPELRSIGQGKVAAAIKQLEAVVQDTALKADADALPALQTGRAATIKKYEAAGVLDKLHAEGVRVTRGATAPKDAAIGDLRAIAKQAPAELPKIGRAFVDELLAEATAEGGFGHAAKIANKWQALGAETKSLLYRDPALVKDLDNFFHLSRMMAENANPSGTAHVLAAAGQGGTIAGTVIGTVNPLVAAAAVVGPAAVSKFLHSAAGVRLLTKGFRIPMGNRAAVAAYSAELTNFASRLGITTPNESQQPIGAASR